MAKRVTVKGRNRLEQLLTMAAVAEHLGIDERTVRRRVQDGTLPAVRVAGCRAVRIRESDVLALLQPHGGSSHADGDA